MYCNCAIDKDKNAVDELIKTKIRKVPRLYAKKLQKVSFRLFKRLSTTNSLTKVIVYFDNNNKS